ncbi:MAG: hypothetical protein AB7J28_07850 [Hyphomonadaceae bacterium]
MIGDVKALEQLKLAARLTGLQHYQRMREAIGGVDGGPREAAAFIAAMFAGMGDDCTIEHADEQSVRLRHEGLRIARGLEGEERALLLRCWAEIWRGAVHSHRRFMDVDVTETGSALIWEVRAA